MKIGIIQAASQRSKNPTLEQWAARAIPKGHEVINFGVFEHSGEPLTYIEAALRVSLLLESGAVDFIITGCSSGQGMMLACNSLPGVVCGYVENPADASLFGQINHGSAVSYPLGLSWGWAGEINFTETIRALFHAPFGQGYPPQEARRKQRDTEQRKRINRLCKKRLPDLLPLLEPDLVHAALYYDRVYSYILEHGTNRKLEEIIRKYRPE